MLQKFVEVECSVQKRIIKANDDGWRGCSICQKMFCAKKLCQNKLFKHNVHHITITDDDEPADEPPL